MEFTEDTLLLDPGTKVISRNNPDVPISGTIDGVAMIRQPVFGYLYIVKLDDETREKLKGEDGKYGYGSVAVPEMDIELVDQ